jgi:ankyrin repeat protein
VRTLSNRLELLNPKDLSQSESRKKGICVRQERQIRRNKSSLLRAAENGHEAVVKLLLERGAELEAEDNKGRMSLSWAAENGHESVVKLLLEKDAVLQDKTGYSRTPLLWAVEKGHEVAVKLLLEEGVQTHNN